MAMTSVRVSVPEPDVFRDVVEEVREAGLKVEGALDLLGVILGSVDEADLDRVRAVPGVGAVEPQEGYSVPEPVLAA